MINAPKTMAADTAPWNRSLYFCGESFQIVAGLDLSTARHPGNNLIPGIFSAG